MQNKLDCETTYSGATPNGFAVILLDLLFAAGCALSFIFADKYPVLLVSGTLCGLFFLFFSKGFVMLQPNESCVITFFGKYSGTFYKTGFHWINPLYSKMKVSQRLHNLDINPIKVNDRMGNPIMIGLVLVWRINDTYKAVFDIDASQSLQKFVAIQSDAALREVAGHYAYDNDETGNDEPTLRSGGDHVNDELVSKLNERLRMAGIEVLEARINYLAYAPEIAAAMLKRQQAAAVIAAREKIVEGAVSMVKLALQNIEADAVARLTDAERARITGNLLLVLCSDESAQPVIPA